MRALKIVLVVVLCVVSLVFCAAKISRNLSGKTEGPTISSQWEVLDVSVHDDDSVLLQGITARDNQDGDLTGKVMVGGVSNLLTENTARVTYLVFDSDDNMGTLTGYVRYTDYRRPVFEVTKPLVFGMEEAVKPLPRLRATDLVDGDISDAIRISTLKGTENQNLFSATAQVTNSLGDTSRVDLPVILRDPAARAPEITLKEQLIYLNREDGFSPEGYLKDIKTRTGTASLSDVTIDNPVDTSQAGTYWVRYSYSDDGQTGIAVLVVVVV